MLYYTVPAQDSPGLYRLVDDRTVRQGAVVDDSRRDIVDELPAAARRTKAHLAPAGGVPSPPLPPPSGRCLPYVLRLSLSLSLTNKTSKQSSYVHTCTYNAYTHAHVFLVAGMRYGSVCFTIDLSRDHTVLSRGTYSSSGRHCQRAGDQDRRAEEETQQTKP